MGYLGLFRYRKCNYRRYLFLGSEMMFPKVYELMKARFASRECVQEVNGARDSCRFPAVCPEEYVCLCPNCGYRDMHHDVSIYESVDVEVAKRGSSAARL